MQCKAIKRTAYLTGIVLMLVAPECAFGNPTFIPLGQVADSSVSYGYSISDDGTAATGYASGVNRVYGFRWTLAGGMADIGAINLGTVRGVGISADGNTVVGEATGAGGEEIAVRWTPLGGLRPLTSGGIPCVESTYACSANGAISVGYRCTGIDRRAVLWQGDAPPEDIGSLGGTDRIAQDITPDGRFIAGTSANTNNFYRPFRWSRDTGMIELGAPPGAVYCTGDAISRDGRSVVGTVYYGNSLARAAQWREGHGIHDLGALGTVTYSAAFDVSEDGTVVVGTSQNTRATVWTPGVGTSDLNAVAESFGVDLGGWILTECRGVNPSATAFVGSALRGQVSSAFVLRGLPSLNCRADVNRDGDITLSDMFDFLNSWFAQQGVSDFNFVDGVTIQDVFAYLSAWFARC